MPSNLQPDTPSATISIAHAQWNGAGALALRACASAIVTTQTTGHATPWRSAGHAEPGAFRARHASTSAAAAATGAMIRSRTITNAGDPSADERSARGPMANTPRRRRRSHRPSTDRRRSGRPQRHDRPRRTASWTMSSSVFTLAPEQSLQLSIAAMRRDLHRRHRHVHAPGDVADRFVTEFEAFDDVPLARRQRPQGRADGLDVDVVARRAPAPRRRTRIRRPPRATASAALAAGRRSAGSTQWRRTRARTASPDRRSGAPGEPSSTSPAPRHRSKRRRRAARARTVA